MNTYAKTADRVARHVPQVTISRFPIFLLTLFRLSPIIATLAENTRSTGVCTYKPLSEKDGYPAKIPVLKLAH